MRFPTRIFLIGLPGAGKSTVGAYLTKELNYSFQDLDDLIEEEEKRPIAEIFETKGELYFRKLEAKKLRQMTSKNLVVATGGGVPCFHDNMEWMNESGFTLFLNPPLKIIIERISKETHRPLIGLDAKKSLTNLFAKRMIWYRQAKMESGLSKPCEILAELLNPFSGK